MAKKQKPQPKPKPKKNDFSKAWEKATGMPMVNQPEPGQPDTSFAKDEKKK